MLILHHITPLPWAVAGALLGLLTLLLLWLTNQRFGISTGFENVCSLAVDAPYLRRAEITGSHGFRLPFLGGLVLGGFVSAVAGGGFSPTWDLGRFDTTFAIGDAGKLLWMFVGGVLIGLGTRMAGGCTSGHGIFGLSNLEGASLVSTLSFLGAGIVVANLLYRVVA